MKKHFIRRLLLGVCVPLALSAQTTISNITYGAGQNITVDSTSSIVAGPNVTVASGANVIYQSTTTTTLSPGFTAATGSSFRIKVRDTDGDGMSDWWEVQYGLNPNSAADAMLDLDGDGISNLNEFHAGTNPSVVEGDGGGALPGGWALDNANPSEAVGTTTGQLSVDKSGALNYSIPLWTTPGTAGMQPQLSLNYSSQGGAGVAGLGWSLGGVSAITRGPQTKMIDGKNKGVTVTADDRFYLDGQRLVYVGGGTGYGTPGSEYRTELDSITKVVANGTAGSGPASFTVWTKAGLIIQFGQTDDSTFDAWGKAEKLSWHVNRISDTMGNYMDFEYAEEPVNGVHRLERINYTGNGSVAPYASVRFEYEDRIDTVSGYVAGSPVSSLKRLKYIRSYYGPTEIARTYTLSYVQAPRTERSMLASLTEAGSDGKAYPPLTFDYEDNVEGWDDGTAFLPPYYLADNSNSGRPAGSGFIDFDGDGRTDFVARRDGAGINVAYRNTGSGWEYNANYLLPYQLAENDNADDQGSRFADVNGDGLVDFIVHKDDYGSGAPHDVNQAWINTGEGWVADSNWQVPVPIYRDGATNDHPQRGGKFLDVNGDGRVDFVAHLTNNPGVFVNLAVYLNNGSGWDSAHAGYSSVPNFNLTNLPKYKPRFIDLNGDGLPDIAVHYSYGDDILNRVWLNTGNGWTEDATAVAYRLPKTISNDTNPGPGAEFTDANGDGLPDLVWYRELSGGQERGAALNTGAGWIQSQDITDRFAPPAPLARDGAYVNGGGAFVDVNADGMADLVFARHFSGLPVEKSVHYGNLRTWAYAGEGAAHELPHLLLQENLFQPGVDFVDFNGDGAMDVVWKRKHSDGTPDFAVVGLNRARPINGRLKRVTNGFGVAVDVSYASLMDPQVYTKAANNSDLPAADQGKVVNLIGPMYVVRSVNNDNGASGTHSLIYSYANLRAHLDRGSLGFGWTKAHDMARDIRTQITYQQEYPFIGQAKYVKVTRVSDAGPLLSETTTTWTEKRLNPGAPYPTRLLYASSVVQQSYDLGTQVNYLTTTTTTAEPDDWGNIGSMTVSTSDNFSKTTTNTYFDSPSSETNWILGRLKTSKVESTAPNLEQSITRRSAFTYTTAGLLESETVEPGDATQPVDDRFKLVTTYGYDPFGNKTSVEVRGKSLTVADNGNYIVGDDEWRTTTTKYDDNGRFPIWTRNARDQQEDYNGYDQALGVLTSMIGVNDLPTTWTYDGFGRKTGETRADGTQSTSSYQWTPAGYLADSKYFIESETTGSAPARTHHDKFGRARWSQTVSGVGQMVLQETRYDSLGRIAHTSVPYFHGSPDVYWTSTTYDLLDRPHTTITPDDENGPQTVTYDYNGFTATATDPKGRVSETVKNSQGWTVSNIRNRDADIDAADYSKVTYAYDALGNLKRTDAAGAVTSLTYDLRGRKETMTDADMGTWHYRYNIFGELIWQMDAKGQIVRLSYDNLGRLITRVESEGTTSWTYDSTSAGPAWKGKLYSVTAPGNYAETYLYDSLGRAVKVTRTIDGTAYDFETAYDGAGRPNRLKYPATGLGSSPFSTRNVYNQYGYLKEIRHWLDSDTDGNTSNISRTIAQPTGKLYWKADSYHVSGRVDGEVVGNGVASDRFYSAATGRLLAASVDLASIISPPYQIQQLIYQYDAVGNVKRRYDAAPGVNRDERFYNSDPADGYDGLDRLKVHRVIGGATVTVGYDRKGNIMSKSDVGSYAYNYTPAGRSSALPHAVSAAGANSYTYDANGNMSSGGGRTIDWTSFNQMRKATDDATGKNSEFFFGAGHERVKQLRKSGTTLIDTTLYVGSAYEKVTTAAGGLVEHKHYIMAPTGRVAVFTDRSDLTKDTRYFHSDGLGSITVVTDENGVVLKRYAYDAWGKQSTLYTNNGGGITNQAPTTRGFTDHEQLADLGLVHMNGRVYDPVLGRFLSADPTVDGVEDAQGYNRYSYVGNNPMNATDPSGYFKLKDILPAVIAIVVTAVVIVATGPGGLSAINSWAGFFGAVKDGLLTTQAIWGGAAGGFSSGFSGSLLNGGSVGDAFKAGAIGAAVGAATAWAAGQIGGVFDQLDDLGFSGLGGWSGRTLAHATVGGLASEAQGGKFRHGFYASAASTGIMHIKGVQSFFGGNKGGAWIAARTSAAAAIGGTASVLGGGKFANGAVTSAFQQLFNSEAGRASKRASHEAIVILKGGPDYQDFLTEARATAAAGKNSVVIEAHTWFDAIERIYAESINTGRFDRVIFSAHGNPADGPIFDGTLGMILSSNGAGAVAALQRLGNSLVPRGTIWFASCEAAGPCAQGLATRTGHAVIASTHNVPFAGIGVGRWDYMGGDMFDRFDFKKFQRFNP